MINFFTITLTNNTLSAGWFPLGCMILLLVCLIVYSVENWDR